MDKAKTNGDSTDPVDVFEERPGPADSASDTKVLHGAENPQNWPSSRKWIMIALVSAIAFNQAMTSTIFAPAISDVMSELNVNSQADATLLVSIFVIGLAIGPLFLAPLSELYGRSIVLHATNIGFLVATIVCAVSENVSLLLVFRWIQGAMSVSLGGAYVADMMPPEQRATAINVWNLGPVLAPIVGPILGGYISLKVNWRWTFWLVSIIAACLTMACFALMRETYSPRLLQLKTRRLSPDKIRPDADPIPYRGLTPGHLIWLSITRPLRLLAFCPIVGLVSVFVGISYSYLYLLFTTFPDVFARQYGFNSGEAGLAYLGLGIGAMLGQYGLHLIVEHQKGRRKRSGSAPQPEDSLRPSVPGSLAIAAGLFWYGWTAQYQMHWILPIIGTSLCGAGITWVFVGVLTYLVDSFPVHAASALAASTVVRSIFGVTIPLAGPPLYSSLGLGWGNTLLGVLALLIVPATLGLLACGKQIRLNPKFQPQL